ncbi:MAG: (2Fe-2S)-binding protein [Bdellovibrio sp.]|nr:(2Fe-2S)-binding protein [Bdellovibrio sp.]
MLTLNFKESVNVLDFLNAKKVSIAQSCGGNGTCTTCRFFVREGVENFSPRSELEIERATERDFLFNERLACQTEITGSAVIEIPDED